MMRSVFGRVQGIAADVLEVPREQITLESASTTIETWDSVHHLNLVLALEQEFNIQFEPEEIDRMTSVQDIVNVLSAKLPESTSA
jgi:acyl carrier protein